MDDWRKVCDALEKAGVKATKRPWYATNPRPHQPKHASYINAAAPNNRAQLGKFYNKPTVSNPIRNGSGNAAYTVLAVNHADRLARFAKLLADVGCDRDPALTQEEWVAYLWEESANG